MKGPLTDKRIVLGVTGSIACYKAVDLASKLVQGGALVDTILSYGATQFVTPLTFRSITHRPVITDIFDVNSEFSVEHVALAHNADLVVIAPATVHSIAKLALGLADDPLTTTAIATTAPIIIAPAMDANMFDNPATQNNLRTLSERGFTVCGPSPGRLASGLMGMGRLIEPSALIGHIKGIIGSKGDLAGKTIVVSAGGTQEPIDPVRVITNNSSGKMGYALAECAVEEGAEVTLISGPVNIKEPNKLNFISVSTAKSMFKAVLHHVVGKDIFISAAAVSDYSLKNPYKKKLKKNKKDPLISLDMEENKDILEAVANLTTRPYLVGFAAETDNLKKNARKKLECKKLDLIVANDVSRSDIGFDSDFNEAILIDSKEEVFVPKTNKNRLAREIINHISMKIKE